MVCLVAVAAACGSASSSTQDGADAGPSVEDAGALEDASADASSDSSAPLTPLDEACTPIVVIQQEDTSDKGAIFAKYVPDGEAFVQATGRIVCNILYRKPEEVRAANKITLILRDDTTIAGGKSGDVGDITVMISTDHLAKVEAGGGDVRKEIEGVLAHEMTHMYQNDDKAPGEGTYANLPNVIEGIADAVRIRAKLPPTGAKPTKTGQWDDEGYWKPAYFLLWIDDQHADFLHALNQSMAIGDGKAWSPDAFADITGRTVDDLWSAYKTAACCTSGDRSCCY